MRQLDRIGPVAATFLVLFLVKVPSVYGVGEEVGRIVGRVTEAQTGAPVPGAAITVTGRPLIGPPRQVDFWLQRKFSTSTMLLSE